jgi:hypothetical protein
MGSQPVTASQPVQVTSGAANPAGAAPVAVKPVTVAELTGPNNEYQAYAARQLGDLRRMSHGSRPTWALMTWARRSGTGSPPS